MEWVIDKDRPIRPQLCEQLSLRIARGEAAPDEKLPSVREIAVAAGVNPNTVQRALEELEQQGLLYSVRGSGWFVSDNVAAARETLREMMTAKTAAYFEAMRLLGMDEEAVKTFVKEWDV